MPFSVSFPLLSAVIYNLPGNFLSNPNKTVLKFKKKKQNQFPATFLELDELQLRCGRSSTCEFSEIHLVIAPYCTHGISRTTLAHLHLGNSARIKKAHKTVKKKKRHTKWCASCVIKVIHFPNTSEILLTLGWPGSGIQRKYHEDTCSLGAHRLERKTRTKHENKAFHIRGRKMRPGP